jgi:hypothetical protein
VVMIGERSVLRVLCDQSHVHVNCRYLPSPLVLNIDLVKMCMQQSS